MHKANKMLENGYKYTRPTFYYTHYFKRTSVIRGRPNKSLNGEKRIIYTKIQKAVILAKEWLLFSLHLVRQNSKNTLKNRGGKTAATKGNELGAIEINIENFCARLN